jgi:hypothetical protein
MNLPTEYAAISASRRFEVMGTLSWWVFSNLEVLRENPRFPGQQFSDVLGFGSVFSFDMWAPYTVTPGVQLGNVPWLAHLLHEHAAYTANTTMMRDLVYPFLRGSTNVYLHFAFNGSDGRLHLPPTASPEYPYPDGPGPDTHYDLALFKWGVRTLLSLAARLDIADPLIETWQDVLVRLVDFPVNEHGYMVDSVNGFDLKHRHFSHLFAIYPLHLTAWADEDGGSEYTRALISTSLDRWMSLTCTLGPRGDFCPNGFTFDGLSSISALAARPGAAVGNISGFIESGLMHAATLYSEGHNPCLESPAGSAAALQEALIQSWGGRLRVFPSVPAAWGDVVVHRLGAAGGLAVSAVRKAGATLWVVVEAVDYMDVGQVDVRDVILVAPGLGPASDVGTLPNGVALTDVPGGGLAFQLHVGAHVALFHGHVPPDLVVAALAGNESQFNFWGLH